jgi:hypothetical protein
MTSSNLYALLRKADDEAYEEIIIICSPQILHNIALMDRLQKASIH